MGDMPATRTRKPAAKPKDDAEAAVAPSGPPASIGADADPVVTAPAITDPVTHDLDGRVLHVRSIAPEGRRRAGLAFTPEPAEVHPDQLTSEALAQLLSDPQLVVEID